MQGGLQGCVLGDQRDQVSGLETTRALLKGGHAAIGLVIRDLEKSVYMRVWLQIPKNGVITYDYT